MSLGSATVRGPPFAAGAVVFSVMTLVNWNGCEPAWVSTDPPAFSAIS